VHQKVIRDYQELVSLLNQQQPRPELLLGEILTNDYGMEACDLEIALRRQSKKSGKHIGLILREMGAVTDEEVNAALGKKLGIPYIKIEELDISSQVLSCIPVDVAFQYNLMPLAEYDGKLIVAMVNPLEASSLDILRFNTPLSITTVMASLADITLAHNKYYSKFDEDEALEESNLGTINNYPGSENSQQNIEQQAYTKPIVRLLNAIVLQGVLRNASDINIRPEPQRVTIFYRIDGQLQYSRTLDKSLLCALVSRIKIIAKMDISERRLPQDGNARLVRDSKNIELRVSVLPTTHGESVVIRILDKAIGLKSIEQLHLRAQEKKTLQAFLEKPSGLFLVTGQTGAGKSTTLYAMLHELSKAGPHVITIEDPVEYDIEGVEQIQILEKKGLTFPTILRHILRHDPDIIMIGEIRDKETAAIASRAALTGHLVLSTLHTNDAPSAITRLLDLGIAPYILSTTLLGVMSQRLVRLICEHCREIDTIVHRQYEKSESPDPIDYYFGKGCSQCAYTGYRGRTLISEILPVSPELAQLINCSSSTQEIMQLAVSQGMRRLTENASQLAREGRITVRDALSINI